MSATGAKAISPAVVGLIAFFTLVDLFAAQAVLPLLTERYDVTPARMSLAVNASTLGMAAAALFVAVAERGLDRKRVVVVSLSLLSIPTALLAVAPDLWSFAALRVLQGVCMATAFGLTLAYLSEHAKDTALASAAAAYIAGNVTSNLLGRLVSAWAAQWLGVSGSFIVFAGLNLAGALLCLLILERSAMMARGGTPGDGLRAVSAHLRDPPLLAAFGLGFCLLFAFLGVFTFVNFVLVRPPLGLGMMAVGLAYLVFAPSIILTPFAAVAARRFGARRAVQGGLAAAGLGLPLLLTPVLPGVLLGMVLTAAGLFFAQAASTGYVGSAARGHAGSANGLYLASYFLGGLAASAVLGPVFDHWGWTACVAGAAIALAVGAALSRLMRSPLTNRRA